MVQRWAVVAYEVSQEEWDLDGLVPVEVVAVLRSRWVADRLLPRMARNRPGMVVRVERIMTTAKGVA